MIRMVRKTISSLLGVALILLMVTLLSYSLMYLSPGDPAETILRAGGAMPSEEDIPGASPGFSAVNTRKSSRRDFS